MNVCLRRVAVGFVFAGVASGWVGGVPCAAAPSANPPPARIRRGDTTFDFPAVGVLVAGPEFCTAVLIGCETVLSAAHCVCPDQGTTYQKCIQAGVADPATSLVFFQHVGFVGVQSIAVDPEYSSFIAGDLAVIKLRQPVSGITPLPINTAVRPAMGMNQTIVGFGRDEGMSMLSGLGVKRSATVSLTTCPSGIPPERFDCYAAPSDNQPSACPGDSGGPLLADLGSGLVVTGVATGARGGDGLSECEGPLALINTDTFVHRAFIEDQLAPDASHGPCGDLPPVGGSGVDVQTFLGEVDARRVEFRDSVDVPAGTRLLRVTMNSELVSDAGQNNFDLFIKAGAPPSPSDFDCSDTRGVSYGACEIAAPQAGKWYVLAERVAGEGTVQLTATRFESLPSSPTPTHTPTRGPTSTPRPPAEECVGDCDGDGHISIAELVRGVALALGNPATPCPDFDPEGDGVGIAALVKAVNGALYGCIAP